MPTRDPFELVLWENVAYLADDEKRAQAFTLLKKTVGLRPKEILSACPDSLWQVARFGIKPELRVSVLRECAEVALKEFRGDVGSVLGLPQKDAVRKLRKFPSIGEPGAEKILLFTGAAPVFALESNGRTSPRPTVVIVVIVCSDASSKLQCSTSQNHKMPISAMPTSRMTPRRTRRCSRLTARSPPA